MSKAKFDCFSIMFHALSTATRRLCLQIYHSLPGSLCLLNGVNDREQSSIKLGIFLIRLSKTTDNLYS